MTPIRAAPPPAGDDGALPTARPGPGSWSGAVMVCGTASGVGKTAVVTGLCRLLARAGVSVAPFKAQNMSNNAVATPDGGEIGRAQYTQAVAAGLVPEVAMNPVLLKPLDDSACEVVVRGRSAGRSDAVAYGARTADLRPIVLDSLADLRRRFDVVIVEGAGGTAEVNLLDRDIVNLPLADAADIPAVIVGDIERGGVFAAIYGTVALLPARLRRWIGGFVINKFRGDASLLEAGLVDLRARTGLPTLGVLPWRDDLDLDAEDGLDLAARPRADAEIDVAVVRLPRLANHTDLDPLRTEPDVSVRFVSRADRLGRPDVVVIPGTRATVADLAWFRDRGFDRAIADNDALVLGLCGGYQMMGRRLDDPVESGDRDVAGLGWLPVVTSFHTDKTIRRRAGTVWDRRVEGYEIRHGRPIVVGAGWIHLDDRHGRGPEGARSSCGRFLGTSLHGLFENDEFRWSFLERAAARVGRRRPGRGPRFAAVRARHHDALADLVATHSDVEQWRTIAAAASREPETADA